MIYSHILYIISLQVQYFYVFILYIHICKSYRFCLSREPRLMHHPLCDVSPQPTVTGPHLPDSSGPRHPHPHIPEPSAL